MRYFFLLLVCCASYSKSSSHRGFPKKLLCACYFAFTFTGEEEEDDELLYYYSPPMLADTQWPPQKWVLKGKMDLCLSLLLRSKSMSRSFLNKNTCSCFTDFTYDKKFFILVTGSVKTKKINLDYYTPILGSNLKNSVIFHKWS